MITPRLARPVAPHLLPSASLATVDTISQEPLVVSSPILVVIQEFILGSNGRWNSGSSPSYCYNDPYSYDSQCQSW